MQQTSKKFIEYYASEEALDQAAVDLILRQARKEIDQKDAFYWAISGGSTPIPIFKRLAKANDALDWTKVHIFWVDERCVSPGSIESNFGNAYKFLLQHLPVQYYRIHAERDDLDAVAAQYQKIMGAIIRQTKDWVPQFDLILLGMGTDGHTASLFPYTKALKEEEEWIMANYVPNLECFRVTMTFPVLNAAKRRLIPIKGAQKRTLFEQILQFDQIIYPIQRIEPSDAEDYWMVL